MPKKKNPPVDVLSLALDGFDYRVECDDFLLYELGRLIEEDQASFQDQEFRRVIDEGIHEHVDLNLEIRTEMARRLRELLPGMEAGVRPIAARVLQAIEDIEFPLHNVGLVVRTYTTYLLRKLEQCSGKETSREDEARKWIQRWQSGEVLREEMTHHLKGIGRQAVAPIADLLFDSLDDRVAAETALDLLGSIPCAVSARILAHVVSEPMLEEDLEAKAYASARTMWPSPRHYILYSLKPHTHEDIPFRWFQLLIECGEVAAAERILEEVLAHADNPNFREDLAAVIELLGQSRDPAMEEKVMLVLNSPDTPRAAVEMLEGFLKTSSGRRRQTAPGPWANLARLQAANKKYQAAAKLFDSGRTADSLLKLDELLKEEPGYPFALMLKRMI